MARAVLETPGEDITIGGGFDVFGTTSGGEEITILTGSDVFLDPSFNTGGDTIRLPGEAEEYTARVEGSYVILESTINDVTVAIPVGTAGIMIIFGGDDSRSLYYDTVDGRVEIDGEPIDGSADPLSPGTDTPPAGQIYNLSAGSETITGTEGDDQFRASNNELGAGDLIRGMGGTDTLKVFVDESAPGFASIDYSAFELESVEQVLVTNDGDQDIVLDMSGATGVELVGTVNSSADVEFLYVTSLADVLIDNITYASGTDLDVFYQSAVTAGTDDTVTVTVRNSDMDDITLGTIDNVGGSDNIGIETVNLIIDGNSNINDLDTELTTLNISGTGDLVIDFALEDTVRNIDATGLAGDVDIDFSNNTVGVVYNGSDQVDVVVAGSGDDVISGNAGNDVIDSGAGNDTVNGGDGNDDLDLGDGNDTATGGNGDDDIDAGAGNDDVNTGTGNDEVWIRTGSDTVVDGGGNDTVYAEDNLDSTDILSFGEELVDSDRLVINASVADVAFTNVTGLEILEMDGSITAVLAAEAQQSGLERIEGDGGDQVILAGTFTTDLTVLPGAGNDQITTGSGDDTFIFANGEFNSGDMIAAGAGVDTINFTGGINDWLNITGIDVINVTSDGSADGFEYYAMGFSAGNADADGTLNINAGGLASNESLFIVTDGTADYAFNVTGGAGDDTVYTSTVGAYDDFVSTGAGNDLIVTFDGDDDIMAGAGDDDVYAGLGDDDIHLGAGDDYAEGDVGADRFFGDLGADYMDLGADADVDTVLYANVSESGFPGGRDTIASFDSGEDEIDISELLANNGISAANTEYIFGQDLDAAEAQMVAGDGIISYVYLETLPGEPTEVGMDGDGYFFVDLNDDGELGGEDLQVFIEGDQVLAGDVDTTLNISGESGYDIFLDDMGMNSMAMAMEPMMAMAVDPSWA